MRVYNDPVNIDATLWHTILTDETVTKREDRRLLKAVYHSSRDHKARGTEVAAKLGKASHAPLNSQLGRFCRRLLGSYQSIRPPVRQDGSIRLWHIPFLGYEERGKCYWIMRPELAAAMGRYLNERHTASIRLSIARSENGQLKEGTPRKYEIRRFDRNRTARLKCKEIHGTKCIVCSFDFGEAYGPEYDGLIETHHLTPLSAIGKDHDVDPIADLVPVCPNCHYVIHHGESVLDIDELKSKIQEAREAKLERHRTSTGSV